MQSQQLSSLTSVILSILGGILVLYSVFFLPMVFGSGGGSFTPTSEWTVANTGAPTVPIGLVLVTLLLLSVLFVLGTSIASFFQRLSPGIVTWRRRAAITALIIQGPVAFVGGFFYTFGAHFGAGYWLALLGCVILCGGILLNSLRPK